MDIKYLGHASFFIKTKTARVVTDPFDPAMVGIKFPKVEADIVTISHHHQDHDFIKPFPPPTSNLQAPLIIDLPGEFEKAGVRITGYQSYHDKKRGTERGENILYKIEAEGISLLHCGDLGVIPEESFLDTIGEVDVLLVPVGGVYTIDADEATQLVKKIEPSIVIPMHYNHPKLNQKIFGQLAPVSEFLKKFGVENLTPIPRLTVKKEEMEVEMKVIVLDINPKF